MPQGGAGTGEQVATSPARSDGNKAQVQAQPGLIARSGQPQTTHPTDNAGTGPVELLQQGARPAQTFSGQTAMPALQSFVRAAVQSNTAQSQGTALSPTSGTSRTRQSQARPEQVQRTSYTPRSEKMVELAREQRDSVFRSIALALSEKGGKAHIQLDPRALGNLAVQMELSGDKLKLEVRVEREELATVMREDLPKLQQQLESRGLVVESINVQTSSREEQQQQALEFARSQRGSLGNSFEANNSLEEGAELGGLLGRGIGLRQGEGINFLA
jgi:flagellar hook-length control protein FliK